MEKQIISLTAQIVSSHIANNDVLTAQLPGLIREVHRALVTAGQIAAEPLVRVTDCILCLDCGRSFRTLKRHLLSNHRMTPAEYRTKWNLSSSYPLVASDYTAARSKAAKESGLGRRVAAPSPPKQRGRPKKG